MVLNVPWATSMWAKGVAKTLNLSLADLLREVLARHTSSLTDELAASPPVGKRAGEGPYDAFTVRADPALRNQLDETADQLGFTSRSELVTRLLEAARRLDADTYRQRIDQRTRQLLDPGR